MIFAVLFSLAITAQAAEVSRDCRDDNGRDRCASEDRARVEAALGMASIENEAATGAEIYRARFVDGYGHDMPAVAFERRQGQSPQVVVYLSGGKLIRGVVSQSEWDAVRKGARFADRTLAPKPETNLPPDQRPMSICLHAWLTTVEMSNSPEAASRVTPVRRRQESACDGALTTEFAFDLAKRAIAVLPDCDALDPEEHRNDITRLAVCGRLEGDRIAAASLMNQIGAGRAKIREDLTPARAWGYWMGTNNQVELTWAGETARNARTVNGRRADALLAAQLVASPDLRAYMQRFNAVSSRRVETTGTLERDRGDVREHAPFAQVWVWDWGLDDWMLESWTVEPFAPVS